MFELNCVVGEFVGLALLAVEVKDHRGVGELEWMQGGCGGLKALEDCAVLVVGYELAILAC